MTRGKLFEYVILHHPEEEKDFSGNIIPQRTRVLVETKSVVALDQREASIRAAQDVPVDYLNKLDEIEILIRPFQA